MKKSGNSVGTVALVLAHLLLRPFLMWLLSLGIVRMILLALGVLAVVGFIALALHSNFSGTVPSGGGDRSGGNSRAGSSSNSSNKKKANKRIQDRIDILNSNIKYRNRQLAKKAADKRVVDDYNKRDLDEIARLKNSLNDQKPYRNTRYGFFVLIMQHPLNVVVHLPPVA